MLEVLCLPALKDNFAFLIVDHESKNCVGIDAPDAKVYIPVIEEKKLKLTDLLITHYHFDHTAGITELKQRYNCRVYGPEKERRSIPSLDVLLKEGEDLNLLGQKVDVIETPGHTLGHISYFLPEKNWLFSGDCLFSLGCGRMFESSLDELYKSLYKLKKLPPETKVYFAHEYTENNLAFSLSLFPDDPALLDKKKRLEKQFADTGMSCPSVLSDEIKTNLFLRCHESKLKHLGENEKAVFASLRKNKDRY